MIAAALALAAAAGQTAAPPATLRLDYVHVGGPAGERFALDRLILEGPWPGPPDRAVDDTDMGSYRFEVRDAATGRTLYSRGFSSIYAEWVSTAEARERDRAFHESLRFPLPDSPARISLARRENGSFREVWGVAVDPSDPAIDRAPAPAARVWAVLESGPPPDKVDVVLLGDGYTAAETQKWHADARRLAEALLSESPFREHRSDFNVWAVDVASDQSGVSRPSDRVWHRTALGASYDIFGSERYALALDNRRVRDVAAAAPYEFTVIVMNDRKYGGGGILNLFSTAAADNEFTPYLLVHEFGHHFAGLADEYYTSDVAYESDASRPEPWEANVTADPRAAKWAALIEPGTPLPTPWPKAEFEAAQRAIQERRRGLRERGAPEAEMEALFLEERQRMTALLDEADGVIGAFEGAMYQATGYYRPEADCTMLTRDEVGFCAVCRRAIERIIRLYAPQR